VQDVAQSGSLRGARMTRVVTSIVKTTMVFPTRRPAMPMMLVLFAALRV
jgi:hypothetical protein